MNLQKQKLGLEKQKLAISRERLNLAKQAAEDKKNDAARGWTFRQSVNIMRNGRDKMDVSKLGKKGLSLNDRQAFAKNYSAYQTPLVPGSPDMNTARALFSGLTAPVSIMEQEVVKRSPVTFSVNGGLNFTAHRQYIYGGATITNGSLSNRLRKYMAKHNISGYVVHQDDMSVNMMDYAQDARVWDINGYVRVKANDFKNFGGNIDKAMSEIGAIKGSREITKLNSSGKKRPVTEEYYDIPTSRTIDSRGFSDS